MDRNQAEFTFACTNDPTTAATDVRITVTRANGDTYDVTLKMPVGSTPASIALAFHNSLGHSGVDSSHTAGSSKVKVRGVKVVDQKADNKQVTVTLEKGNGVKIANVPRSPMSLRFENSDGGVRQFLSITAAALSIKSGIAWVDVAGATFSIQEAQDMAEFCARRLSRRGWSVSRASSALSLIGAPGQATMASSVRCSYRPQEAGFVPHTALESTDEAVL